MAPVTSRSQPAVSGTSPTDRKPLTSSPTADYQKIEMIAAAIGEVPVDASVAAEWVEYDVSTWGIAQRLADMCCEMFMHGPTGRVFLNDPSIGESLFLHVLTTDGLARVLDCMRELEAGIAAERYARRSSLVGRPLTSKTVLHAACAPGGTRMKTEAAARILYLSVLDSLTRQEDFYGRLRDVALPAALEDLF